MTTDNTAEIKWATPPHTLGRRATIHTPELLAGLKANPGKWALILKSVPNVSASFQFAKRNPGFEITTRRVSPSDAKLSYDVYMRYVDGAK